MRKVYAIWFIKKVAPIAFLQMPLFLLIALRETAREFWVSRIFENFIFALNDGMNATANYLWSSLSHAPIIPVSIVVFSLVVFGYSIKRLVKSLKQFGLVKSY